MSFNKQVLGWSEADGETVQILQPKASGYRAGVHAGEAVPLRYCQESSRKGTPSSRSL